MRRKKPTIDLEHKHTIKEVCDLLDICPDTIRKYAKSKTIVSIRVSSREIYYLGTEVEILFNALTAKRKKKTRHAND